MRVDQSPSNSPPPYQQGASREVLKAILATASFAPPVTSSHLCIGPFHDTLSRCGGRSQRVFRPVCSKSTGVGAPGLDHCPAVVRAYLYVFGVTSSSLLAHERATLLLQTTSMGGDETRTLSTGRTQNLENNRARPQDEPRDGKDNSTEEPHGIDPHGLYG